MRVAIQKNFTHNFKLASLVGWALPTSLKSGISEQDAQCSEQDAQCSEQDAQCSEQDAQCSEQDAQCSEQDAQCSEQDAHTTTRISPLLTLRFKCRTAYDK
ncbi:hypothetical protein [Coleofasciculus chthonoplastes]|jgi:hypothetical protein|uniref:hypothetical protein n=1 Tax=Coleofasciculus chthonoplastes TaxID=64178 RepID=UPI0032F3CCF4